MSWEDKAKRLLEVPSDLSIRRLEHAVALYVAYQATKAVVTLGPRGLMKKAVGAFLSTARFVPGLKGVVEGEENELFEQIEKDFLGIVPDPAAHVSLPEKGAACEAIVEEATALRAKETKFHSNKAHAGIYYAGDSLAEVQRKLVCTFLTSNLLYPGVFQSCRKFEAEVISMVSNMVHGACGSFASGGSEAVFLAVKAHRDWALATKGITEPEVVACVTAHPCLDKACYLLKVKMVKVGVDEHQRIDLDALKRAITGNTAFVYASAPTFPHGVVDPIEEMAAITTAAKVGLHVDNCFGGFLLSHLSEIGEFTRNWDFRVRGVTSMSVDVHKFGSAPKGASIVVYHSEEMRRFQYYSMVEWPGGLYATPTVQGSRPGAAVAGAWGTLLHIGREGYCEKARLLSAALKKIVAAVKTMPGLGLLGSPDACSVAFTSEKYNIYTLSHKVNQRGGWTLVGLQNPAGAHITLGDRTLMVLDDMLADIRAVAEEMDANPDQPAAGTMAAMYGNNAMLPKEEMEASLLKYLDLCYKVKPIEDAKA